MKHIRQSAIQDHIDSGHYYKKKKNYFRFIQLILFNE